MMDLTDQEQRVGDARASLDQARTVAAERERAFTARAHHGLPPSGALTAEELAWNVANADVRTAHVALERAEAGLVALARDVTRLSPEPTVGEGPRR